MERYQMKFMFDWASGTCLWSTNDKAKREYGYPVDISELPISDDLKKQIFYLVSRHDEALNWDDPASDLLWTEEQRVVFNDVAKDIYDKLCCELGSMYEITIKQGCLI